MEKHERLRMAGAFAFFTMVSWGLGWIASEQQQIHNLEIARVQNQIELRAQLNRVEERNKAAYSAAADHAKAARRLNQLTEQVSCDPFGRK